MINHSVIVKFRIIKKLKRKPSLGKFGADFQRQPFSDVFLNRRSSKFRNTGAFFNKVVGSLLQNTNGSYFWNFFQWQQIPFSDKSGMYCRQSHRILSWTLLKTRVKPQKQPLQLFYKKRCSQKFCKFHRKTPVLNSLSNRVAGQQTKTQVFPVKFTKFLKT